MKITVGELCEKLDILNSLENKLRDGTTLQDFELEKIADMINDFYSMGVASKTTGIPQPNIFKVCNGERNTAGGYKWRYKDD